MTHILHRPAQRQSRFTLNTDGEPHPLENTLAIMTLVGGLVSAILAINPAWHVPGAWAGAAALVIGAVAQMVSATTAQRWVVVIGWVLAFVGTIVNVGHGGFV